MEYREFIESLNSFSDADFQMLWVVPTTNTRPKLVCRPSRRRHEDYTRGGGDEQLLLWRRAKLCSGTWSEAAVAGNTKKVLRTGERVFWECPPTPLFVTRAKRVDPLIGSGRLLCRL